MTTANLLPDPKDLDAWTAWADERLHQFDLSVRVLHQVAVAGQRKKDRTSPLSAPIMRGIDGWDGALVALREATGWGKDERGGLPRTVHPSGRFFVVVLTGAHPVGVFGATPQPKNGLRPMLRDLIDDHPTVVPLFDAANVPVDPNNYQEPELWLFLWCHHEGYLYSELCSPLRRDGDRITAYRDQIPLPPLPYDHDTTDAMITPDDGPDPSAGPVIDVQPR
ncbi:hypothetical protein [Amycolatopsis pigmentata]|uniref:Uncharacterized protein n=1 Tax=Amycolatopsis pigmentata TaxID=450801 RepID=A0ABW5FMW2_9PSEU